MLLSGYLLLHKLYGLFIGKAGEGDAIAHDLYHASAVLKNEVGEVESVFLSVHLGGFNPATAIGGWMPYEYGWVNG